METWDLFCTVIDNYGDIGITWRLARQLAAEHDIRPRLWVDDLHAFRAIRPQVDPALEVQHLEGVEIRPWRQPWVGPPPGDVVIEALACNLPEDFIQAMARREPPPVWINLEYLSAEEWVRGCHGLPSPHPRLPLVKYFFMPGYGTGTGGVLKESWLDVRRQAFQSSVPAMQVVWDRLGLPEPAPGATRISLFAYATGSVADLLDAWSAGPEPVELLVPRGLVSAQVDQWCAAHGQGGSGTDKLRVYQLPMLDQDDFDRLLWACDCNFVRGEDSFVRAQWAGRPLVWQAYRQEEDAHWPKIHAFLALYRRGLPEDAAQALTALWTAWNRDQSPGPCWAGFWRHRDILAAHARDWMGELATAGDLAGNLVQFCHAKCMAKS